MGNGFGFKKQALIEEGDIVNDDESSPTFELGSVEATQVMRCISLNEINEAYLTLQKSAMVRPTPVINDANKLLDIENCQFKLHLKMETFQLGGTFKIRGVVNQFANLSPRIFKTKKHVVCACDGNFALAFALGALHYGFVATVLLPDFVPIEIINSLKKIHVNVRCLSENPFDVLVEEYSDDPLVHIMVAYNDLDLVAGYASLGVEILMDVPQVDIVLVGCGTGGLLSGVAAGIKLNKPKCLVYGVEPIKACNVFESLQRRRPIDYVYQSTIATALQSTFTGPLTYAHCVKFVSGIIRVTDEEIITAVQKLYTQGFVVEPSGSVSLAACLAGKVPRSRGRVVVAVLTGRNMSIREFFQLPSPNVMGITVFPKGISETT